MSKKGTTQLEVRDNTEAPIGLEEATEGLGLSGEVTMLEEDELMMEVNPEVENFTHQYIF